MYCEIYRCHMSVAACIARQENARKYVDSNAWGPGRVKPGALDINCQNCKQGKEIMEHQGKDEHSTSNIERPMMNEKDGGDTETRVCSQPDCEAGGCPQPIENFQKHFSGSRLSVCKACMEKKRRAGKMQKQKGNISAKQEGDLLLPGTILYPELVIKSNMLETLLDGLPEVLKTIEEMAREQERTPIAQVRYFLKTDYRITGADAE